ncbi:hypothetical protein HPP92_022494 [Vanilla planifolia]|uniref:Uncharacterized protein n=1 Tax=Vanilla planifolia TaxID=51239 RepID=A0A835PTM3_VANPL|nr:hypothetical protein HPP92_022494 [Vanilla planifolia]
MGCFLGCFKGPKESNRSKEFKRSLTVAKEKESLSCLTKNPSPRGIIPEAAVTAVDDALQKQKFSTFPHIEVQEQVVVGNVRKKVTFDLNVITYENVPVLEGSKDYSENGPIDIKVQDKAKEEENETKDAPKSSAFPTNHRYQNCESSDDEDLEEDRDEGEEEDEESDFGEDDVGGGIDGNDEESYDSFFSLPMENEKLNFLEVSSPKANAASSTDVEVVVGKTNARDRSRYVHSVLNPVENLSHWREVKTPGAALNNISKENIDGGVTTKIFFSPDPNSEARKLMKPASSDPNPKFGNQQEISVDASLSNWLVSPKKSESSPSKPSIIPDERPILGALTMEDIKQFSRTSSPRRSPSRSPDEIPIVGTVGSYWSSKSKEDSASSWSSCSETRGIPNSTSKYKEDKRVNWHSTPFEARLERALDMESSVNKAPL